MPGGWGWGWGWGGRLQETRLCPLDSTGLTAQVGGARGSHPTIECALHSAHRPAGQGWRLQRSRIRAGWLQSPPLGGAARAGQALRQPLPRGRPLPRPRAPAGPAAAAGAGQGEGPPPVLLRAERQGRPWPRRAAAHGGQWAQSPHRPSCGTCPRPEAPPPPGAAHTGAWALCRRCSASSSAKVSSWPQTGKAPRFSCLLQCTHRAQLA